MSYQPRRLKKLQNSGKRSKQSFKPKQANYRASLKQASKEVPMTPEDCELMKIFKEREKYQRATELFDYDKEER